MSLLKENIFKAKYLLYNRSAFSAYKSLMASQYWSQDEIKLHQKRCQERLVRFAMERIAFYKSHFGEAGFELGDMAQEGWFEKLPILTRTDLQNSFNEITFVDTVKHTSTATTGGSTGEPVKIRYDKRLPYQLYGWRTLSWWGLNPWDDGGYVWRNPRTTYKSKIANHLLWWPTRKLRLDASAMSKESMLSFVRDWNRVKPPQLQGYVGAMVELAQFVDDSNIEFNKPEVVWVTSAPLSKVQRSLLERVFRAPVYDQYGCCELPWIAAQCEVKQYLHVNAEIVGLEFVDDNNKEVKSGEWGRLLLTRFYDLTFPIIRYEVGDNGRFVNFRCSCDRTLPLIDSIKGRTTDTIRLPSGRILSGDYLTTIFDDFPSAVSSFQVVQKRDSSLVVRYVASEPDSIDNVISKIKKTLEGKVNSEVSVSFKRVNEIRHERGKLRFVVKE